MSEAQEKSEERRRFEGQAAKLFGELTLICSGRPILVCLEASVNLLAQMTSYASPDLEYSDKLIDDLVPDIKKNVRDNWKIVQEAKLHGSAITQEQMERKT